MLNHPMSTSFVVTFAVAVFEQITSKENDIGFLLKTWLTSPIWVVGVICFVFAIGRGVRDWKYRPLLNTTRLSVEHKGERAQELRAVIPKTTGVAECDVTSARTPRVAHGWQAV